MCFYSINSSLDKNKVGKYPQVEDAVYHCDVWKEPRFIDNASFKEINFEPIVANAKLVRQALPTDLISADIIGFHMKLLISGKFKSILESVGVNGLQYFSAPLISEKGEISDYWIVNPFEFQYKYVNFDKTKIYLMKNTFNKVQEIHIDNLEDFFKESSNVEKMGYPYSILIEEVNFLSISIPELIVLQNVEGGTKYFVSNTLRTVIETSGCTGIEFQPSNLSLNEWLKVGGEREKIYGKI